MDREKIVVTIPLEGPITVEALGYEGPACALDLKRVSDLLGEEESVRAKPEYHRQSKERERSREGRR